MISYYLNFTKYLSVVGSQPTPDTKKSVGILQVPMPLNHEKGQ